MEEVDVGKTYVAVVVTAHHQYSLAGINTVYVSLYVRTKQALYAAGPCLVFTVQKYFVSREKICWCTAFFYMWQDIFPDQEVPSSLSDLSYFCMVM